MKILGTSTLLILALATVLTYSGCDNNGGGDPTVEEVQLEKLSGTWTVVGSNTNVTLTAVSKKTEYATFEVTLTGTPGATSFGYTTANRPALSPWPSTGTWKFGDLPESQVIRDDDKPTDRLDMTYAVSDTQLQITFNFTGAGYNRTKQVTGEWIFTLAKKP